MTLGALDQTYDELETTADHEPRLSSRWAAALEAAREGSLAAAREPVVRPAKRSASQPHTRRYSCCWR